MTGSPAPSRFVRRHLGQAFGAALFLFGGLAFLVIGVTTAIEERRYAWEGGVAEARIVRKAEYWYTYTDYLGRAHEGATGYISRAEAAGWKPGDTGAIRYDRKRPAESIWLGRA